MDNNKLLKESYKLLIPITNKILFERETTPEIESKGFKLSEKFLKSLKENKKDNNPHILRIIEIIYQTIFNYDVKKKKQILAILYDNEQLIQITYMIIANHNKITFDEFVKKIFSDYVIDNYSNELTIFLNYHFIFIYEEEFQSGYISENDYIDMINKITKRISSI